MKRGWRWALPALAGVALLSGYLIADTSPAQAAQEETPEVTEEAEKDAIGAALAASEYHREQTAKSLGISVRTLHYKMSRYGLH